VLSHSARLSTVGQAPTARDISILHLTLAKNTLRAVISTRLLTDLPTYMLKVASSHLTNYYICVYTTQEQERETGGKER